MPGSILEDSDVQAALFEASSLLFCDETRVLLINRRSLLTLDFACVAPAQWWVRAHRTIMACRFEVALPEEDARHVDAALEALDEADRLEAALTVFRDTSELSRINRRPPRLPPSPAKACSRY